MANHLITAVEPGSIAEELGIEPGDWTTAFCCTRMRWRCSLFPLLGKS